MEDLGRYLGAHITKGRSMRGKFQFILDQMQNKLSGWKKQTLSLAGRLTLVESVTNQMVVYYMQLSHILAGVRQQMAKLQSDFVWGIEEGKWKIPAESWEVLCSPKERGGHGLKELGIMNDALLGRIWWKLIAKSESLCSLVLKGKYGRRLDESKEYIVKDSDSEIWKNVGRLWPNLIDNVQWELGDGRNVGFWLDKWVDDGSKMINHCAVLLQEEERKCTVRELVNSNGDWNYQKLEELVTKEGSELIKAVPPPCDAFGRDRVKWGSNLQNNYVVSEMYMKLREEQGLKDEMWRLVWRWKGPCRIQIFLWLAIHNRLLTRERRSHLFECSRMCFKNDGKLETLTHVLRDCISARKVWTELGQRNEEAEFYQLQGREWMRKNFSRNEEWKVIFGVTCWKLWY